MSYCVWFTCRQHTCGCFSLQKTNSRGFYRKKKPVWTTSKRSGQNVCSGEHSSSSTQEPSLPFTCFFCLSASPDCGVPSPLFSGEIRSTCRRLKGICSAHQVCIISLFLWEEPPENVKKKYMNILQCGHSLWESHDQRVST